MVATFKRRSFCPEYRDFSLGLRHRRVDWETTHPNAVQVLHVGPGARGWGLQMKAYADRCSPGGSRHSLKFPALDMVAAALRTTPLDTGSWRTAAVERALQNSRWRSGTIAKATVAALEGMGVRGLSRTPVARRWYREVAMAQHAQWVAERRSEEETARLRGLETPKTRSLRRSREKEVLRGAPAARTSCAHPWRALVPRKPTRQRRLREEKQLAGAMESWFDTVPTPPAAVETSPWAVQVQGGGEEELAAALEE